MSNDVFSYALSTITAPAGSVLWLNGEPNSARGDVYQTWKGQAELLAIQGCNVFSQIQEIQGTYDAVFVNIPKQREEAEGLLALALKHSNGFVMAAAANNAGGTRLQGMLEAYGLAVHHSAKSHARAVWVFAAANADAGRLKEKLSLTTPRQMEAQERKWWTQPGLFGWDKIDAGSQLLLQHIPQGLSGNIADFGCGYGYISARLAEDFPAVHSIDAYDADARAVDCCKRNSNAKVNTIWQDIENFTATPRYDAVVMNPPFHSGKVEDIALGKIFIRKALDSLKSGGQLFMVANRHLGYEKSFPELSIIAQSEGYKIMSGRAA